MGILPVSAEERRANLRQDLQLLLRTGTDRATKAAHEKLSELGAEGIEILMSIIHEESEKRKRRARFVMFPRLACVMVHLVLLAVTGYLAFTGTLETTPFFLVIFSGCIWDIVFQLFDVPSPLERRAVSLLADLGDKGSVGLIIEALLGSVSYAREALMKGLERILPTLNAGDGALLSLDQIKILNDCLRPGDAFDNVSLVAKSKFQIAILRAYEQIGDSHTLETVRAVAREHPKTVYRQRVVEAAIACLPYLEERVGKDERNNRLLRPARSGDKLDDSLLRPAAGNNMENAEHLLRAVE